jgi:hypothetical protein
MRVKRLRAFLGVSSAAPRPRGWQRPFQVGERGHHRLLAAHGEVHEPFERRKDPAVFLGEAHQRAEDVLGRPGDDAAVLLVRLK